MTVLSRYSVRQVIAINMITLLICTQSLAKDAAWTQKMHELSETLSALMPDLVSNGPVSPDQAKRIEAGAKSLMSAAHTINMKAASPNSALLPDFDPTIRFVSDYFKKETSSAYHSARNGRAEYARAALRSVTSYCIACHTRHEQGASFPELKLSTKVDELAASEQAQFYSATRQFDKALAAYDRVISDNQIARTNTVEWGNAVRQALTIAVRVKRDPKLAAQILSRVQKLKEIPEFYRENVAGWTKSVAEWAKEHNNSLNTESQHYAEALRVYNKAKAAQQYPLDHSADVYFLRVSLLVHELLSKYPSGKYTSEALWLAGSAYDLLENRMMSPLPQNYFEACIRHTPHSKIAQKCFRRFEENVYFGFTGSAGTSIPADIAAEIAGLRKLAMARPSQKK